MEAVSETGMEPRTARCHCGDLQVRCAGAPRKISMCHCADCQRRTGSAFSIAVFFVRDDVSVSNGSSATFERPSASGFSVLFHFCPRCGSNVLWEPRRLPDLIGIAAGAFANPRLPRPDQSVWTKDKHHWLALPEGMPCFDTNPPPR
jgi:hypothetical protein